MVKPLFVAELIDCLLKIDTDMSLKVSILNNKGNFITNSNDSSSSTLTLSSSSGNRYYLYDVDDDDITKQSVIISSDINISNINSSSSSQDDATYIYITSSFDDNIIPMTLSSLSIISNAKFVEIYTSSTTNTTTATYDYLKTVRGTGMNNIFTCSIDDIIRRVKSLKIKFLSVKDVTNTTSPTVKIYNIDCTINTDSDMKLNIINTNTTSKSNTNNDAGGSTITTNTTSDAGDSNSTRGNINLNPISTINPQMMMTYFNELDKMIDMKLSPIFKRLDAIEKDIVYLKEKTTTTTTTAPTTTTI